MKNEVDFTGLEQLNKNASELSGEHSVQMGELMNPKFISNCSQYSNLDELFNASGFKIESNEDFEAIPDEKWESFIQENTTYESWQEMQEAAGVEYARNMLLKGLK